MVKRVASLDLYKLKKKKEKKKRTKNKCAIEKQPQNFLTT